MNQCRYLFSVIRAEILILMTMSYNIHFCWANNCWTCSIFSFYFANLLLLLQEKKLIVILIIILPTERYVTRKWNSVYRIADRNDLVFCCIEYPSYLTVDYDANCYFRAHCVTRMTSITTICNTRTAWLQVQVPAASLHGPK